MLGNSIEGPVPDGFKLKQVLRGHLRSIHLLAWSTNGQMLASVSSDNNIELWNGETWELHQINHVLSLDITCLAWSSDAKYLALASINSIVIWNVETDELY